MRELVRWVLGVDRRVLVMKEISRSDIVKPAKIAERYGRSVQNISRAIHELEGQGLVECLTPSKKTWKRYILTEKGKKVYQELMKSGLLGNE
ncbi:MAG: winged helix DNA-binding protein [Methanomassiliicoccales archaeon]